MDTDERSRRIGCRGWQESQSGQASAGQPGAVATRASTAPSTACLPASPLTVNTCRGPRLSIDARGSRGQSRRSNQLLRMAFAEVLGFLHAVLARRNRSPVSAVIWPAHRIGGLTRDSQHPRPAMRNDVPVPSVSNRNRSSSYRSTNSSLPAWGPTCSGPPYAQRPPCAGLAPAPRSLRPARALLGSGDRLGGCTHPPPRRVPESSTPSSPGRVSIIGRTSGYRSSAAGLEAGPRPSTRNCAFLRMGPSPTKPSRGLPPLRSPTAG